MTSSLRSIMRSIGQIFKRLIARPGRDLENCDLENDASVSLSGKHPRDVSREIRRLGVVWLAVLTFTAVLLLAGEIVRWQASRGLAVDATLINLAGRQRTLSQLLVERVEAIVLARQGRRTRPADPAVSDVRELNDRFQRSQAAILLRRNQDGLAGANSAKTRQLFQSLQPHYQKLVAGAEQLLDAGELDSADPDGQQATVAAMRQAANQFLPIMDRIVSTYEMESGSRLARSWIISWSLTGIVVIILGAISFTLVGPLLKKSLKQALIAERALANATRASEEASRLADFARYSTNGMVRTDANRRIVWVNDGFTRITGFTLEESLGKSPGELLQCDRSDPDVIIKMRSALREGKGFCGQILNRSKFGRDYWLDLEIIPERDCDGNLSGFIAIESDVTDLIEAKELANRAKEAADAANRAKSEFLANMSHEIRTPMTAILGYTDLLAGDFWGDPARSREAIGTIQSNAGHLLTIINDILDVSKLEAGQLSLESIDTNPVQIVEEVASLSRPRAIEKQIDFRVRYETLIPKSIQSDPTRLRQVLLNLASNAIKFTETGSVTIRAAYDGDAQQLRFAVEDTGIGMTPEQCDAIAEFTAFKQADMSTTRKFGGTGLGLHISSSLSRMLGGRLELDSVYGKGSRFTAIVSAEHADDVELWIPEGPMLNLSTGHGDPATGVKTATADSLCGLRILLAEDGRDNQRLISHHLKKAGADVAVCDNGQIAVDRLIDSRDGEAFDLVLMDMQMPELDGYQATRLLRRRGFTLPIIALTAHAMEGDRQKCLAAGCDDYVTKPINRKALIATCATLASSELN